jgi:hypothetical protein
MVSNEKPRLGVLLAVKEPLFQCAGCIRVGAVNEPSLQLFQNREMALSTCPSMARALAGEYSLPMGFLTLA